MPRVLRGVARPEVDRIALWRILSLIKIGAMPLAPPRFNSTTEEVLP